MTAQNVQLRMLYTTTALKSAGNVGNVYYHDSSDEDSPDVSSKLIGAVNDQSSSAWTVSLLMNDHN